MICRFKASLKERLKWRSEAGPTRRMPLYLSRTRGDPVACRLGSIRGSFNSSARISAKFVEGEIDLHQMLAGVGAALAFALAFADDIAFVAFAGSYALRIIAVAKVGEFDSANGDGDEVLFPLCR